MNKFGVLLPLFLAGGVAVGAESLVRSQEARAIPIKRQVDKVWVVPKVGTIEFPGASSKKVSARLVKVSPELVWLESEAKVVKSFRRDALRPEQQKTINEVLERVRTESDQKGFLGRPSPLAILTDPTNPEVVKLRHGEGVTDWIIEPKQESKNR